MSILVEKVKLSAFSDEYEEIQELFKVKNKTKNFLLQLETVEKVYNYTLMQKFNKKEEEYKRKYGFVKTVKLFHGTKKCNIPSILKTNFDVQRHGQNIGHRFGAGVSFSAHATYASHYCDKSSLDSMLLCKVLVSNIVEVQENRSRQNVILEPPLLPGRFPLRYDTTAKHKETMDVIVKFENHTFYPSYVVSFKRLAPSSQYDDDDIIDLISEFGFL